MTRQEGDGSQSAGDGVGERSESAACTAVGIQEVGRKPRKGTALTMPEALATSKLLCPKLPLWLVETVFCRLPLRPMASIDWLRLRITR